MQVSRSGRWAWITLSLAAGGVSAVTTVPPHLSEPEYRAPVVASDWTISRKGEHWDLDWTGVLRIALARVDAVDISPIEFVESEEEESGRHLRIEGREALDELVAALEVDPEESGDFCMCEGQWSLRFLREGVPVSELRIKHLERLGAGFPGWPGEGVLTPESVERLVRWFDVRGYPHLLAAWKEARREAEARAARSAAMRAPFGPESAADVFDGPGVRTIALRSRGDEGALARAAFISLGRAGEVWTSRDQAVMRLEELLASLPEVGLLQGVDRLAGDRDGLHGAAIWFFGESRWCRLPAGERGPCAESLAEAAVALRGREWAWTLARDLGSGGDPGERALLWRMADGKFPLPPPQAGEPEVGPSLAAAALLQLAGLGESGAGEGARSLIAGETDTGTRQALEVTLAHLGDAGLLRVEHFASPSRTVREGAIRCAERFPRRETMEPLVEALRGELKPTSELCDAFCRISGLAHGHESHLRSCKQAECVTWWERNGAAFLAGERRFPVK